MSKSDEIVVPDPDAGMFAEMSGKELLEAIYASQMRTEMLVQKAVESLAPTVEAFSKGGVMGLMGMLRR